MWILSVSESGISKKKWNSNWIKTHFGTDLRVELSMVAQCLPNFGQNYFWYNKLHFRGPQKIKNDLKTLGFPPYLNQPTLQNDGPKIG